MWSNEYVATITLKDGFVWADASEELSKTVVIKVVKYIGYYDTPYKLSLDLSTIDNTPNVSI